MCSFLKSFYLFVESNDDSGRIEVVVEGLALTQELGSEYDVGNHHLHGAVGRTLTV